MSTEPTPRSPDPEDIVDRLMELLADDVDAFDRPAAVRIIEGLLAPSSEAVEARLREALEAECWERGHLTAADLKTMREDARRPLSEALEAIVVRCVEGDKRTDWLPVIADIARAALASSREGTDGDE